MSRIAEDIRNTWLKQLLPSGSAWTGNPDSNLAKILLARAVPRSQLESDIAALSAEISPGTSRLLLADYQAVLGPDPYGRDIGDLTADQLRALLLSRWVARGGQSIAYYRGLGAAVGIDLTIQEPENTVCGTYRYGDGAVYSRSEIDRFTWLVVLPNTGTGLEPVISGNCQPDTQVVFVYQSADGFGQYRFDNIRFGA